MKEAMANYLMGVVVELRDEIETLQRRQDIMIHKIVDIEISLRNTSDLYESLKDTGE